MSDAEVTTGAVVNDANEQATRDSIENLLHEFEPGITHPNLVADEIWNRIVGPALTGRPGLKHIAEWLDHKSNQLELFVDDSAVLEGKYDAYVLARSWVNLAIDYPERWLTHHQRLMARKTDRVATDD